MHARTQMVRHAGAAVARADLQHGQGGRARADEDGAEHARLLPDLIRGLGRPRLSKKDDLIRGGWSRRGSARKISACRGPTPRHGYL